MLVGSEDYHRRNDDLGRNSPTLFRTGDRWVQRRRVSALLRGLDLLSDYYSDCGAGGISEMDDADGPCVSEANNRSTKSGISKCMLVVTFLG